MNLKELTWPIRIYWDLDHEPSDSIDHLKICDEILELKILFLSLREASSLLSAECTDILAKLKNKNMAVSLTIQASALNQPALARLSGVSIKPLLINVSTLDEARAVAEKIGEYKGSGTMPGISFDLGRENFRDIPNVVSYCLDKGISNLVFPIQRLEPQGECFFIGPKEREELSRELSGIDYRKMQITIHDPFLWQVFFPEAEYHEGGCQAANSMLYISPEYKVYPCPAMPLELGDLHKTTLREIILSAKKKELRHTLLSPPEECASCDQAMKCLGGCRGRAFAVYGSLNRIDPACRGKETY